MVPPSGPGLLFLCRRAGGGCAGAGPADAAGWCGADGCGGCGFTKNDIRTFLNQDAKCRRCEIENKWIIAPKTASEGCEIKRKTRLIYDRHSGGCGIKGNVPFRTRWIGPHAGGRCPSADIPAKNIPATRPVYRMQNSTSCSRNVIQQIVYDQRPVGEITTIKKAEWRITRCEN